MSDPSEEHERTSRIEETTVRNSPEEAPDFGYTYGEASGNHLIEGKAHLPESNPIDIPLDGIPVWVVGASFGDGIAWTVALEDGSVETFRMADSGEVREIGIASAPLAPGEPPLLEAEGDTLELGISRNNAESDLTHPSPISYTELSRELVGIQGNGELFVEESNSDGGSVGIFNVTALLDARITASDDGKLAVLSGPTGRYAHGVLGDGIEADSMTVLESVASGRTKEITPESGGVFEGIAPLWFEGGEGRSLLAVTESADGVGSRVSVYEPDGNLAAAGPFIGEAFKWRHVLAAGPFGPDGELEIAAVRTPHVAPVVEFYRLSDGRLEIVAEVPGYTSHRIYTRNLDTAISGDLDADGRLELLVPDPTYTELAAIRRDEDGASVAWRLDAGGEISTNVGSATDEKGRSSVAVGRSDGTLRVWR